jgi:hypothetical protein
VGAAEAFGDLKLTDGDIMTETIIEKEKEKESTMARLCEKGLLAGKEDMSHFVEVVGGYRHNFCCQWLD